MHWGEASGSGGVGRGQLLPTIMIILSPVRGCQSCDSLTHPMAASSTLSTGSIRLGRKDLLLPFLSPAAHPFRSIVFTSYQERGSELGIKIQRRAFLMLSLPCIYFAFHQQKHKVGRNVVTKWEESVWSGA